MSHSIFGRGFFIFMYSIITLLGSIEIILQGSIGIGISALAASALAFCPAYTFVGSFFARKEKRYSFYGLLGIGAIAAMLVVAGFALAHRYPFQIDLLGYMIDGYVWLVLGLILSLFVTKKQDAL